MDLYAQSRAASQEATPNRQPGRQAHRVREDSSPPTSSIESPAPTSKRKRDSSGRKKLAPGPAPQTSTFTIPPYTPDPDLDSPAKCREYLAYHEFENSKKLEIEDDDWEDVTTFQTQEWVGKIYDALSAPATHDLPDGIEVRDAVLDRFRVQQDAYAVKVRELLSTPKAVKVAKARCLLLFEQAVLIHERGVPQELLKNSKQAKSKGRHDQRKFRLDADSTCSQRLDKMIDAITTSRVVAYDVVSGNNYDKLSRFPIEYRNEKFTYLSSNKTRQEKADQWNSKEEEKEKTPKKPRLLAPKPTIEERDETYGGSDGETEEEMEALDEEEYEPPSKKRVRR